MGTHRNRLVSWRKVSCPAKHNAVGILFSMKITWFPYDFLHIHWYSMKSMESLGFLKESKLWAGLQCCCWLEWHENRLVFLWLSMHFLQSIEMWCSHNHLTNHLWYHKWIGMPSDSAYQAIRKSLSDWTSLRDEATSLSDLNEPTMWIACDAGNHLNAHRNRLVFLRKVHRPSSWFGVDEITWFS